MSQAPFLLPCMEEPFYTVLRWSMCVDNEKLWTAAGFHLHAHFPSSLSVSPPLPLSLPPALRRINEWKWDGQEQFPSI